MNFIFKISLLLTLVISPPLFTQSLEIRGNLLHINANYEDISLSDTTGSMKFIWSLVHLTFMNI